MKAELKNEVPSKPSIVDSISVCSSFYGITKPAGKVNPKIQALVNAVINDGIEEDEPTSEDMKVPDEKKILIAVKKIDKKKRSVP